MKMLKIYLLAMGLWISSLCFGQAVPGDTLVKNSSVFEQKGIVTVGVDVFKNIPFLVAGNGWFRTLYPTASFQNKGIFEIMARKKAREHSHWVGLLGYAQAEITDTKKIERRQSLSGWYGKGGMEWALGRIPGHSHFGLRGMLTYCRYATDLLYEGPAFGDYRGFEISNNAGIGYDLYYAYDFFLRKRWMLRWETRWTHHQRLIGKGFTPYYPGVGIKLGYYNYIMSVGTTLQLHYRF